MKKIMESLKSLMDRHRLVSAGLFLFVIAVFYIFIWNDAPYLQYRLYGSSAKPG